MSEPRDPTVTESEGAPQSPQPAAGTATDLRTFMIADIRGYTTYTEQRGDEAGAELVRRFSELVSEVVTARDGMLLELRGDEALVVFVSARKALRAAVDLQARVAAEVLPRGIGIGLDAGEAIPVGDGFRGTALNLAARLCAKAAAGETLASEAVIHLAAKMDGIAYVDARDLRLKGYSDSVRAILVVPSDRAGGRRLVTDRRSANRRPVIVTALVAVVALALIATSGYLFLSQGGDTPTAAPTNEPGTSLSIAAASASTPASATPAASVPAASPTGPIDPLGGAALPVLAFYDQATGALDSTTSVAVPSNISLFAGGSFWILANKQFDRVDPTTHAITQSVNVPLDEPNGYAWDDDYFWITDLSGPRVFRVDQRSGTAGTPFELGKDAQDTAPAFDVAVGGGSVWLTRPDDKEIVRLDSVSGDVKERLPIEADGLSYGSDALWFWSGGTIGRIDPITGQESFDPVKLTDENGLGNIYFAGGDAWTSSADVGTIYRVDRSGTPRTYSLAPGVGEMAPTDDTMWVTNANTGALTGIDITSGQSDRTIDTGHATLAAATGAGQIMVAVGPTVDEAIAALPGSVLTVASGGFPWWYPAPDPPLAGDWQVQQGLNITCANLMTYPDEPWPTGLDLVSEVADGPPALSADGLTYTFTIKPGFMFSPPSNEPVTAETFRYSLERAVSPVFPDDAPGPGIFADIAGVAEYRAGTADTVTGLVADDNKLTITLVTPEPDFLMRLATTYACPVPTVGTPALISGLKPDPPVAGDGPYYLAQTIRKRLVVFKKNPNYHGSRQQPFDEIAVRLQVAPTTALGLIQHGGIDAVMFDGGDSLSGPQSGLDSDWGAASASALGGDQRWFGGPRPNVDTIVLNQTQAPFNDPSVRRAVALVLDRSALSKVWVNEPSGDLLAPSFQGSEAHVPPAEPDVNAALALMNGRTVKATMLGFPEEWGCGRCQDFEDEVKAQLGAIGIDVTVVPAAGSDYPGDGVFDSGSNIDMLDWGLFSDLPDPVELLSGLQSVAWLGKSNLDTLAALNDDSGQTRIDAAVELSHKLVDTDNLVVPTGYAEYPFFVSERIGCGFVQPALGAVDLLSLCVTPDAGASPPPASSPAPSPSP